MLLIDNEIDVKKLSTKLPNFWNLSGQKVLTIEQHYDHSKGSPVFTEAGKYTTRGWTEWTQGFQYGAAILQFDATNDPQFLEIGRKHTVKSMATHISHIGVHDHGFNNVSTYGNLLRLMQEGRIELDSWEKEFYQLAIKVSGAVQASRWTSIKQGGYIHSFNGAHSLFVDTIRSCRALMLSHVLGHELQAENDIHINLLDRALQHIAATAKYAVYYGEGRDHYDLRGRTAHESVFNVKDGQFRCPNSQQGYTGFSTWTRGLAWAICGFAEELELLTHISDSELDAFGGRSDLESMMLNAARATCDFYIEYSPKDGIPYWDTGAPNLHLLGDYHDQNANPYNEYEPVDSSAAAIACQGLMRLGHYLKANGDAASGQKYFQAGLTVLNALLQAPYLSTDQAHQGLLLHSIYHRPNSWDYVAPGAKIPYGESSMWGDYHIREAALYVNRLADQAPYYTFFNGIKG